MNTSCCLKSAGLELTRRCTARCVHCGSASGQPRDHELTRQEFAALLGDLAALGTEEICLLGGEPLCCPFGLDIAREASTLGISTVLITNGTLLSREIVDELRCIDKLSRVAVSLDGATAAVHDAIRQQAGSFARAVVALERLRDAGIQTGVITTVMRLNLGELAPLRDWLAGRGCAWQVQVAGCGGARFPLQYFLDEQQFYEVGAFLHHSRVAYPVRELAVVGAHDLGYFSAHLRDYGEMPQLLWEGCLAGLTTLGVTSAGEVKGCLALPDACVEGSVRQRSLVDIWRDPACFTRNRCFTRTQLGGFCARCEFGGVCRGGCPEIGLSTTGSLWSNAFCFHRLEVLRGFSPRSA